MPHLGTSASRLRHLNRSAVLAMIARDGPVSRADVARRLGLSPAAVTALTRGLLDAGVIALVDRAASRGGRPGELLAVVGASATAAGVKIAADHATVVRSRLDGTILEGFTAPFDAIDGNPLAELAGILEHHLDGQAGALLGVGVGLPGFEDPPGSGIVQAPVLGWRHLPLGEHLTRVLGLPILIDNDVNMLTIAQLLYGLGRDLDSYLTITLGRGIGLGIVLGGELYRGARGAAGEVGHVPVSPAGEPCACGKRGCLEALASETALAEQGRRGGIIGPEDGVEALVGLAAAGDPRALHLYRRAGRRLGYVVAGLATVFNPEAVVVTGEGLRGWPYLVESFTEAFEANLFPAMAGQVPVRVDEWDDAKWALGGAASVLHAPLASPRQDNPVIEQIRSRFHTHRG